MKRPRIPLRERFEAKVQAGRSTGDCNLWAGAVYPNGYGAISTGGRGKVIRAHRAAYELYVGPIPAGMCVLHRCDVPACVNPLHLFLGTKKDNTLDMIKKGRVRTGSLSGEKNPSAKLSKSDVALIKERIAVGTRSTARELACEYGVSTSAIYYVVSGRTWSQDGV